MTGGGDSDQIDAVVGEELGVEGIEPIAGIVNMINVQHGETGWDGFGGDALAILERGGMRDDDGQAAFEGLLAVVVVRRAGIERGYTTADVRHFGTVDELVPDFGSARLGRAFADAFLITKHNYNV